MKSGWILLLGLMSFQLLAQTLSTKENQATRVKGVYILLDKPFTHEGPIPGKQVGSMSYDAYQFYVSAAPFNRAEATHKKLEKVIYSTWTKEGHFKIKDKAHRVVVLKATEDSVDIKVD